MRSAFINDATAPTGIRFQCAACGCEGCSRVSVRKPNGSSYSTEFVECSGCRVLYHWIGEPPRAPVVPLTPAPAPTSPDFSGYMIGLGESYETGMSPDEHAQISEAAARAVKSRGSRR